VSVTAFSGYPCSECGANCMSGVIVSTNRWLCDACWNKQQGKGFDLSTVVLDQHTRDAAEIARLSRDLVLARAEVERMRAVYEAAVAWEESDCSTDCPLFADGPHAHHCPERVAIMRLVAAIDAAGRGGK